MYIIQHNIYIYITCICTQLALASILVNDTGSLGMSCDRNHGSSQVCTLDVVAATDARLLGICHAPNAFLSAIAGGHNKNLAVTIIAMQLSANLASAMLPMPF